VNAGRRTRSPAGNLSPSDYSSLRGSRSSDGNLGASSFLPFLSLPASQPSRCTSADPIRVCLCIRPKPLATASSSLRRLRVRSLLLSSVSSSNRRKVASVSQLGLAKKQREQRQATSTIDHHLLAPAPIYNIASTTSQLKYPPSARASPSPSPVTTSFRRRAACLLDRTVNSLGELSSVWRTPLP
jgi:hypothetical protein